MTENSVNSKETLTSLGKPLAEFGMHQGRVIFTLLFFTPFAILMFWFFAASGFQDGNFKMFVAGAGMICLCLSTAWYVFRQRGLRVLVLQKGIAEVLHNHVRFIDWNEIQEVYLNGELLRIVEDGQATDPPVLEILPAALRDAPDGPESWAMKLADSSGDVLRIPNGISKFNLLARAVQFQLFHQFWSTYWNAFCAGKRIHFGPISLETDGIATYEGLLLWNDFECVTVRRSHLEIHAKMQRKAWFTVSAEKVPNPHLLVKLACKAGGKSDIGD